MTEKMQRDYEQRFDREAVLAALPDWMYDKLQTNEPITDADRLILRGEFFMQHPELAARIDPVEVVQGWRYGRWWERNHGRPEPELPPRTGRKTST